MAIQQHVAHVLPTTEGILGSYSGMKRENDSLMNMFWLHPERIRAGLSEEWKRTVNQAQDGPVCLSVPLN